MPVIRYFLLIFIFLLSCATKDNSPETKESSIVYASQSDQSYYMNCHFFADNSFQGLIYNSSKEGCIYLDIIQSPKNLFNNNNLFVQIYPFTSGFRDLKFGPSSSIYTISKEDEETVLMKSFIIDAHLITVDMEKNKEEFFLEHKLEICDLDEQWEGLQIVIFERRKELKAPIPIRTSKMLIPPFLVHPEYFREIKGELLVQHHPFFDWISEYQSEPQAYYDGAEDMCSAL